MRHFIPTLPDKLEPHYTESRSDYPSPINTEDILFKDLLLPKFLKSTAPTTVQTLTLTE